MNGCEMKETVTYRRRKESRGLNTVRLPWYGHLGTITLPPLEFRWHFLRPDMPSWPPPPEVGPWPKPALFTCAYFPSERREGIHIPGVRLPGWAAGPSADRWRCLSPGRWSRWSAARRPPSPSAASGTEDNVVLGIDGTYILKWNIVCNIYK